MTSSKTTEVARYTGVTLVSGIADYAVFLSLVQLFGQPVIESLIGYTVAVIVNFHLTRTFVYAGRASHKSEQRVFAEFMATGVLGLILTGGVVWTNTFFIGAAPATAKAVAMVVCFVVLYIVRSRLVFTEQVMVEA